MLRQNITKEYKKSNKAAVRKVDEDDKKIASDLELEDRIYTYSKRDCFITIKDHKPNY